MAITAKIAYAEPLPQPQPIEAVLSPHVAINLLSNEAVFQVCETLLAPDGSKTTSEAKRISVLLSDAQLKALMTTVLAEAQAQGKLTDGTLQASSIG